jgi:ribosomal-protein-alanine N-acetyltransferase
MNFIETERLVLKVIDESEINLLADYYLRNLKFLKLSIPVSEASYFTSGNLRDRVIKEKDLFEKGFQISLYVFKKNDAERIIGNVSILNINGENLKNGFLGYQISEDENGNGYATEAAKKVIEYLFTKLNFGKTEANVMTNNIASVSVLEKLGFEKTEFLKNFLEVNGRAEDHFRYSLLNKNIF